MLSRLTSLLESSDLEDQPRADGGGSHPRHGVAGLNIESAGKRARIALLTPAHLVNELLPLLTDSYLKPQPSPPRNQVSIKVKISGQNHQAPRQQQQQRRRPDASHGPEEGWLDLPPIPDTRQSNVTVTIAPGLPPGRLRSLSPAYVPAAITKPVPSGAKCIHAATSSAAPPPKQHQEASCPAILSKEKHARASEPTMSTSGQEAIPPDPAARLVPKGLTQHCDSAGVAVGGASWGSASDFLQLFNSGKMRPMATNKGKIKLKNTRGMA